MAALSPYSLGIPVTLRKPLTLQPRLPSYTQKALYSAPASFCIKHLNPVTSSAQRRWFCSSSSSTCPGSIYDSSSHDDSSDSESESHIPKCPYVYENPFITVGSRKLFELVMGLHEATVRLDLPGVNSSGIEVFYRDDFLEVRGKELPTTPEGRAYVYSVPLIETELLKKEETKAEIENGVLRVIIPKHVPQEEHEEENNEKDAVKVTGSITSPADVPVSLKSSV